MVRKPTQKLMLGDLPAYNDWSFSQTNELSAKCSVASPVAMQAIRARKWNTATSIATIRSDRFQRIAPIQLNKSKPTIIKHTCQFCGTYVGDNRMMSA